MVYRTGENLLAAHSDHFSQRFVAVLIGLEKTLPSLKLFEYLLLNHRLGSSVINSRIKMPFVHIR